MLLKYFDIQTKFNLLFNLHGIVLLDRQSPTTHVFKRYKEFHMFFVLAITKEQRQKEATRNYLIK